MQICSGQDVFERQAHCLPALQDIADENNRTAGIFNRRHEAIYQQMRQDTRIKAAWTEGDKVRIGNCVEHRGVCNRRTPIGASQLDLGYSNPCILRHHRRDNVLWHQAATVVQPCGQNQIVVAG